MILAAYVANAHLPEPEIVLAIASQSASGAWYTDEGTPIHPFWTTEIEIEVPSIPDGWIEHLHDLANKFADNHRAPEAPKPSAVGLLSALGLGKPKVSIQRRF